MLGLRRRNLVGIDIDTSTVRMVQLRKDNGGYVIVKAIVVDITPWGNDPQLHAVHTLRAIQQGLTSTAITTRYAVCGLRGSEVVVRDFEFPALTPEEIAGAVELEVSQICPFLAEESTFDYQVTASDDKKTMGFWVAATNDLIQGTRQLVTEAGLHCALVDVAGLALLNLLAQTGQAEGDSGRPSTASRSAVLNLGDSCVSIAIADPAGRPFVRDIGNGVAVESRALVGAAGRRAAEDGWTARPDGGSVTDDALVEDVATTLRYYWAQNGSARVDRLLVCGAVRAEEVLDALRARLNIAVEPWNPLGNGRFRVDAGTPQPVPDEVGAGALCDLQEYGPSLAVATGLAMRSI